MMKKTILILSAAVLMFTGCFKDRTAEIPAGCLYVTLQEQTRIHLDSDSTTVWDKGDLLTVFNKSTQNECWKFDGETGTHGGTISRVAQSGAEKSTQDVVALYPYTEQASLSSDGLKFQFPEQNSLQGSKYSSGTFTMAGITQDENILLKNTGGWVGVKIRGKGLVTKLTIKGNNGEKLSGEVTLDPKNMTLTAGQGAHESVSLTCRTELSEQSEQLFLMSMLPVVFEKGFTLDVEFSDGEASFTKKTSSRIEIARNTIVPMAGLNLTLIGTDIFSPQCEDKAGMNLRGVVYDQFGAVEGALVSDGITIAKTDSNGRYWINSPKTFGSVYIILPSGWEVPAVDAVPQFWQPTLDDTNIHEQHDFRLVKSDTSNHTVLVATDIHISNRNLYPLDLTQFQQSFCADVTRNYSAKEHVYVMNLGDFAWDGYWYDYWAGEETPKYALQQVKTLPVQWWSTMGNHDNNGHAGCETKENFSYNTTGYWKKDLEASAPFRRFIGPTHISFNLGSCHYILIDDINYENDYASGATALMGGRNYHAGFRPEIMQWIKADLSHVSKDTPILIGYHIPVCNAAGTAYNSEFSTNKAQWDEFIGLFNSYSEVDFISGHTHETRYRPIPGYGKNLYEHNISAVSGIWWGTSRGAGSGTSSSIAVPGKVNLNSDGTPCGYMVYEVSGRNRRWHWKSAGPGYTEIPQSKQMHTYDMNEVKKLYTSYNLAQQFKDIATSAQGIPNSSSSGSAYLKYTAASLGLEEPQNSVWINCWGFEKGEFASHGKCRITVTENGKTTDITTKSNDAKASANPIEGYRDPLFVCVYDIFRYNLSKKISSSSMSRSNYNHIFRYVASSPDSELTITFTDRWGRSYTETMKRPKVFYNGDINDTFTLD